MDIREEAGKRSLEGVGDQGMERSLGKKLLLLRTQGRPYPTASTNSTTLGRSLSNRHPFSLSQVQLCLTNIDDVNV